MEKWKKHGKTCRKAEGRAMLGQDAHLLRIHSQMRVCGKSRQCLLIWDNSPKQKAVGHSNQCQGQPCPWRGQQTFPILDFSGEGAGVLDLVIKGIESNWGDTFFTIHWKSHSVNNIKENSVNGKRRKDQTSVSPFGSFFSCGPGSWLRSD